MRYSVIDLIQGKIFKRVVVDNQNDEIRFYKDDDKYVAMYHRQDCCECVTIDDINGDVSDLENTPILVAEERWETGEDGEWGESFTWTFYTLRTAKGSVDIKWYGSSNGYYSESVYVEEVKGPSNMPWDITYRPLK